MGKIEFNKYAGIKDVGDVLSTRQPFLRQATNVDVDDEGKVLSRREGYGAPIIAGNYGSLWSNKAKTIMLGVNYDTGDLVMADPENLSAPTRIIRSGLTTAAGMRMDYCEVDGQIFYSDGQTLGFIEAGMDGAFPAITKTGGSRLPAGRILEHHGQRLYSVLGGRVAPSAPLDYGRASLRKDFLWFSGEITLFRSVPDGIYVSYGTTTIFLQGKRPAEFVIREVADYPALPGTAFKFDASLVSSNVPLQGTAAYWMSTQGPCIGFAGGQMLNLALTKVVPIEGITGASILRTNRKGFEQALTILQN